jgi:hypothetical protein
MGVGGGGMGEGGRGRGGGGGMFPCSKRDSPAVTGHVHPYMDFVYVYTHTNTQCTRTLIEIIAEQKCLQS